jgi:tetratricopeptide (TPR) repeat protein
LRRSLLHYDDTTQQYRIHELLRDIARIRRSAEDDYTAHLRHAQHYLAIYREAQRRYDDPQEDTLTAIKLFDASWAHIRAAAAWVATTPTLETDKLCVYAPQNQSILDIRLQPRELIAWCDACAAAARRRGNRHDEALALHGMGNGYLDTDFERAKECFEQCLAIAREIGDRQLESWALNGLGTASDALGDFQQAVKFYEQVLAIRRELRDTHGEGRALSNLGMMYSKLDDFRHSIKCYTHSLTILRQVGDGHTESFVLNNLGNDYVRQGQVDRGLKYLFQSLSMAQTIGNRRIISDACWSIGEALVKQGEYVRAAEFMQQTVDYEREIGHPYADEDAQVLAQTRALTASMDRSPISGSG